jgi:hypothetical protein
MSKRFAVKMAAAIAALSAVTLLSGCADEEDALVLTSAWTPVGYVPAYGAGSAYAPAGTGGGGGQSAAGASSGGAAAAAAAGAGGGNQVSGGMAGP